MSNQEVNDGGQPTGKRPHSPDVVVGEALRWQLFENAALRRAAVINSIRAGLDFNTGELESTKSDLIAAADDYAKRSPTTESE